MSPAGGRSYGFYLSCSFAQSLFANTALIFVNSVFLASVGGKSYSNLYFLSNVAAMLFYVAILARPGKAAGRLYAAVLAGAALLSACLYAAPGDHRLIYAFAVAVTAADLIGTSVLVMTLQANATPSIFRDVYQRQIAVDLTGRVAALAVVGLLGRWHHLSACYFFIWAALAVHLGLFVSLTWGPWAAAWAQDAEPGAGSVFKNFVEPLRFLPSNSLVQIAAGIIVWTYAAKFLVEYVFYQTVSASFPDADTVSSFISVVSLLTIAATLLFQRLGGRLLDRLPMSWLVAAQPLGVLALGSLALLGAPFIPVVVLMVFFQCANRGIQLPVSRQCLVPVPRGYQQSIQSLILLVTSLATLILSACMIALKAHWALPQFLMLLLALSALILFFVPQLDSCYIRNLWSFYREGPAGGYADDPWNTQALPMDLAPTGGPEAGARFEEEPAAEEESPAAVTGFQEAFGALSEARARAGRLLTAYLRAYHPGLLGFAVARHKELLGSGERGGALAGLSLLYRIGLPTSHAAWRRLAAHADGEVRAGAAAAMAADKLLRESFALEGSSSATRRRLRELLLERVGPAGPTEEAARLAAFSRCVPPSAFSGFVAAAAGLSPGGSRTLFDCLRDGGERLSLEPLFERLRALPHRDGAELRAALERVSAEGMDDELAREVRRCLSALVEAGFSLRSRDASGELEGRERLLFHALYLDEWRSAPSRSMEFLRDSIAELEAPAGPEQAVLVHMHLEFLKNTETARAWRFLLGADASQRARLEAVEGLEALAPRSSSPAG